ncbi:MAG: hypothetical protein ACPGJS_05710 [Flammeovirgaceae bacterium]
MAELRKPKRKKLKKKPTIKGKKTAQKVENYLKAVEAWGKDRDEKEAEYQKQLKAYNKQQSDKKKKLEKAKKIKEK